MRLRAAVVLGTVLCNESKFSNLRLNDSRAYDGIYVIGDGDHFLYPLSGLTGREVRADSTLEVSRCTDVERFIFRPTEYVDTRCVRDSAYEVLLSKCSKKHAPWFLIPANKKWFRDLAVLQFMDVLGVLLDSGYTVVEALSNSVEAISNCAVKQSVSSLRDAVTRGERFSRELDKQGDLFPPVVSQLVIVGEKTGNLSKSTAFIREHLRREIERSTNIMVGTIEPILTIGMACMIGVILLSIYLPMFDMIGAMNGGGH